MKAQSISKLRIKMKLQPLHLICLVFLTASFSVAACNKEFVKVFLPDGMAVTAELAVTDEERQLGLMHREKIEPDQAMLFIFEEKGQHSFWMRNMKFPLDILWLDAEKRIVHIGRNIPPCPRLPCPSYSPEIPALYVLELKAGSADAHQLKMFDRLEFVLPKDISSSPKTLPPAAMGFGGTETSSSIPHSIKFPFSSREKRCFRF